LRRGAWQRAILRAIDLSRLRVRGMVSRRALCFSREALLVLDGYTTLLKRGSGLRKLEGRERKSARERERERAGGRGKGRK
jgi:hypothetical protein